MKRYLSLIINDAVVSQVEIPEEIVIELIKY